MGAIGSFAVGTALGLLFMLVTAVATLARTRRRSPVATGMERLARGAAEWEPLPAPGGGAVSRMWQGANGRLLVSSGTSPFGAFWHDGRWEATTELPPRAQGHPTIVGTSWRDLPDGTYLTASAGSCEPRLEPSKATLPPLPRCDPALFDHRLRAATRTSAGHLLVLVQHLDGATHVWKLAPDAAEWVDTGATPFPVGFARLVPGSSGDALLVGGDGAMARFDGERWTPLPRPVSQRVGWQAALAEDGAVLAAGGFEDTQARERRVSWAIALAFLVAVALAVQLLEVGIVAMLAGGSVGVVASVGLFYAVWIAIGARF